MPCSEQALEPFSSRGRLLERIRLSVQADLLNNTAEKPPNLRSSGQGLSSVTRAPQGARPQYSEKFAEQKS